MKTFKGVVLASIVFDVYLQINDVIKEIRYPVFEKGTLRTFSAWTMTET